MKLSVRGVKLSTILQQPGYIFVKGSIMFIQVKAIRKGIKPPVWRRACIPLGMNVAQMAFILETLLELPVSEQYEFEFFQEKDRLIEGDRAERTIRDFQFTYRNAVKAAVNDWAQTRTWFTFRLKKSGEDFPQYRVEIESLAGDIKVGEEMKLLDYPLIVKEVSSGRDRYWTAPQEINKKLQDTCFFKDGEAEYPDFASVCQQVSQGKGLKICRQIESLDNLIYDPSAELRKEISDRIEQLQNRIEELNKEIDARKKEAANISSSRNPVPETGRKNTKPGRTRSVEEVLRSYTKEDLKEMAEEYGCRLHSATRARMAYELARHILEPDFMRDQLLEMDESELDAFEEAIAKERYLPGQDEMDKLKDFVYLDYVCEFTNDMIEVPEDVAAVYGVICTNGYREFHKKARWLIDCLYAFAQLYAVGRTDLLYRLYCQTDCFQTDRKEFDSILEKIPDKLKACRKIGSRIVAEGAVWNKIYLEIEKRQRDVPYYIPSKNEILDYARNGYPASEPAYRKLFDFFRKDLGAGKETCKEYCMKAFFVFSMEETLSDYMDFLNEKKLVFKSDRQMEKFVKVIMDVNNSTRMFALKGHTPMEMQTYTPLIQPGRRPKIVPISSDAAKLLEEGRELMQAKGFDVDTDETGTAIPVMYFENGLSGAMKSESRKVYPNDPCPCGSGKKFKKCCGRVR